MKVIFSAQYWNFFSYLHTTSSVNQLFSLFQIIWLRHLLLNWPNNLGELNFSGRPVTEIQLLTVKLILVSYPTIFHFLLESFFIWDSYLGLKNIGKRRQGRENIFISCCIFERALAIKWKGKDQWIEDSWEASKGRNSKKSVSKCEREYCRDKYGLWRYFLKHEFKLQFCFCTAVCHLQVFPKLKCGLPVRIQNISGWFQNQTD